MCLSVPKKILSISGEFANLETGEKADISLIDSCHVGDFVIINAGVAVSKVGAADAALARKEIKQSL